MEAVAKLMPVTQSLSLNAYRGQNDYYDRLERYMEQKGIADIGNQKFRQHLKNPDRPASLDIDKVDRAWRTIAVMYLSQEGLAKVHLFEDQNMDRFLLIREMRKIAKEDIQLQKLRERHIEALIDFQNQHKPPCRRYQGLLVPPYFLHDLEFDGMLYHHAWDKCIHSARREFVMPMDERDRKISDEL